MRHALRLKEAGPCVLIDFDEVVLTSRDQKELVVIGDLDSSPS